MEIEFLRSSSRFLQPSTRYAIYANNNTSLDAKHTLLVYLLFFKSKRILRLITLKGLITLQHIQNTALL